MKFSIRDLLLVTVIVAIAVAWWLDRSRLAREVQRLKTPVIHVSAHLVSPTDDSLILLPDSSAPSPNPPKE